MTLTLEFYKRNYIEGLFLSSGVIRSPDHTMEELIRVARTLRRDHGFAGYIHLKAIPEASPWLVEQAGLWADRLSINLELPTERSLARLAPEKRAPTIRAAMGQMRERIAEAKAERRRFAPAGQSTQVIVGADDTTDATVLAASAALYDRFALRRVYYSAFSPIPEPSPALPLKPPPLVREHRLYQADWLVRFYGFTVDEIAAGGEDGMLDLEADPKLAWALKHREQFPVDVNRAPRELLLRVPGLGVKAIDKLIRARRHARLRLDDLARLTPALKRALPFLVAADHRARGLDRHRPARPPRAAARAAVPVRMITVAPRARRRPRRLPTRRPPARRRRRAARGGRLVDRPDLFGADAEGAARPCRCRGRWRS